MITTLDTPPLPSKEKACTIQDHLSLSPSVLSSSAMQLEQGPEPNHLDRLSRAMNFAELCKLLDASINCIILCISLCDAFTLNVMSNVVIPFARSSISITFPPQRGAAANSRMSPEVAAVQLNFREDFGAFLHRPQGLGPEELGLLAEDARCSPIPSWWALETTLTLARCSSGTRPSGGHGSGGGASGGEIVPELPTYFVFYTARPEGN
jgi:hypothetical protein